MLIRSLRDHFEERPHLSRIASNISWLSVDQLFRLALGLVIGVWIARYLGPIQFGLLSYATAFVSITGSFATLGLQGLVVRELVLRPIEERQILGSALLLQFTASAAASLIAILSIQWANRGDATAIALVSILALSLPFQSSATVRYLFESKVLSRYVVWGDGIVFLIIFFAKLLMIVAEAPLVAFAWVVLLQSVLTSVALGLIYLLKFGGFGGWRPEYKECAALLSKSWPLALSSIAIIVYTRTDQIMLQHLCQDASVGVYAAALKLAEVWYTIPTIVTASVFPFILSSRAKDPGLYKERFFALLRILVMVAIVVATIVTFTAGFFIDLLFGSAFADSISILRIQIWSSVFVFLGVASGSWLIAEGLQLHSFFRTLAGALINIVANLILIPSYGALGAAIGTFISQLIAAYFMDLLTPETREMFKMKTRALMFWRSGFSLS
jgi:PST family polysaccharide transporter